MFLDMLVTSRLWFGRQTGYEIYIQGLDAEICRDRKELIGDLKV